MPFSWRQGRFISSTEMFGFTVNNGLLVYAACLKFSQALYFVRALLARGICCMLCSQSRTVVLVKLMCLDAEVKDRVLRC